MQPDADTLASVSEDGACGPARGCTKQSCEMNMPHEAIPPVAQRDERILRRHRDCRGLQSEQTGRTVEPKGSGNERSVPLPGCPPDLSKQERLASCPCVHTSRQNRENSWLAEDDRSTGSSQASACLGACTEKAEPCGGSPSERQCPCTWHSLPKTAIRSAAS